MESKRLAQQHQQTTPFDVPSFSAVTDLVQNTQHGQSRYATLTAAPDPFPPYDPAYNQSHPIELQHQQASNSSTVNNTFTPSAYFVVTPSGPESITVLQPAAPSSLVGQVQFVPQQSHQTGQPEQYGAPPPGSVCLLNLDSVQYQHRARPQQYQQQQPPREWPAYGATAAPAAQPSVASTAAVPEVAQHVEVQTSVQKTQNTVTVTVPADVSTEQDELICYICQRSFDSTKSYARHIKRCSHHKRYRCDSCPDQFNMELNLMLHVALMHSPTLSSCPECGKQFLASNRHSALRAHLCMHEVDDSVKCPSCGDEFEYETQLRVHLRTVHNLTMTSNGELSQVVTVHRSYRSAHRRNESAQPPAIYFCRQCFQRFDSQSELRSHSDAHRRIKESLRLVHRHTKTKRRVFVNWHDCAECGKKFTKASSLERHLVVHSGRRDFECRHCGQMFNQRGALMYHENTHTSNKPYVCDLCGQGFAQRANMRRHIRALHPVDFDSRYTLPCPVCSCVFTSSRSLNIHVTRMHREVMLRMNLAEEMQQAKAAARSAQGMRSTHSTAGTVRGTASAGASACSTFCPVCAKRFQKQSDYVRHMRTHNNERPFKCAHCSRSFATRGNLTQHVQGVHLRHQSRVSCYLCSQTFCRASLLSKHLRLKHTSRDLAQTRCRLCNRSFGSTGYLLRHIRQKHQWDDLNGTDRASLAEAGITEQMLKEDFDNANAAMQTAEDESGKAPRRYGCQLCARRFLRSDALLNHFRCVHLRERRFKCQKCMRVFGTVSNLNTHLRGHVGVRNHHCPLCSRSFAVKSHLKRHITDVHNDDRPFRCPYCTLRFKRGATCRRHMKTHRASDVLKLKHQQIIQDNAAKCLPDVQDFSRYATAPARTGNPSPLPVVQSHRHVPTQPHPLVQHQFSLPSHSFQTQQQSVAPLPIQRIRSPSGPVAGVFVPPGSQQPTGRASASDLFDSGMLDLPEHLSSAIADLFSDNISSLFPSLRETDPGIPDLPTRPPSCPSTFSTDYLFPPPQHAPQAQFGMTLRSSNPIVHPTQHAQAVQHQPPPDLNRSITPSMHRQPESYRCLDCALDFVSAEQLEEHRADRHERIYYPCGICNEYFSDKYALNQHKMVQHGLCNDFRTNADFPQQPAEDMHFSCMLCLRPFKRKFGLFRHLSSLHNVSREEADALLTKRHEELTRNKATQDDVVFQGYFDDPIMQPAVEPIQSPSCFLISHLTNNSQAGAAPSNEPQLNAAGQTTLQRRTPFRQPGVTVEGAGESIAAVESMYQTLQELEGRQAGTNVGVPVTPSRQGAGHGGSASVTGGFGDVNLSCLGLSPLLDSVRSPDHISAAFDSLPAGFTTPTGTRCTGDSSAIDFLLSTRTANIPPATAVPSGTSAAASLVAAANQHRNENVSTPVADLACPKTGSATTAAIKVTSESTADDGVSAADIVDSVYIKRCSATKTIDCPFCSKNFKRPADLERHVRIHTGEKPFKCPHCDKAFRIKSTLRSHVSLHGEPLTARRLQHQCSICDKYFATKTSLRLHLRMHTEERPFACEHCSETFTSTSYLNSHLLSAHHVRNPSKRDQQLYHSSAMSVDMDLQFPVYPAEDPRAPGRAGFTDTAFSSSVTGYSPYDRSRAMTCSTPVRDLVGSDPEPSSVSHATSQDGDDVAMERVAIGLRNATEVFINFLQPNEELETELQGSATVHTIASLRALAASKRLIIVPGFGSADESLCLSASALWDVVAKQKQNMTNIEAENNAVASVNENVGSRKRKPDKGKAIRRPKAPVVSTEAAFFRDCLVCKLDFATQEESQEHFADGVHEANHKEAIAKLMAAGATQRRPHACKACVQTFSAPSKLQRHILTHTREAIHECEKCSKRFAQRATLRRHLLDIHMLYLPASLLENDSTYVPRQIQRAY